MDGAVSEAPFTIEVFRSDDQDSGHGGSLAYLGSVSTSSSSWTLDVGIAGDHGDECRVFTSTATNVGGSTSEFSANFRRGNCPPPAGSPAGPDYLGGAPLPTTITQEGDVLSLVPAGAFKWDAYLSVVEAPKTGSFRIPGTNYWQTTSKYEVWWKAFSNNAQIVSTEVAKPFTLVFTYLPEAFEKNLSERNLKLAFSSDGKKWQILPRTILNTKNNTISVVTKSGGYYMLVSGYYLPQIQTLGWEVETQANPEPTGIPTPSPKGEVSGAKVKRMPAFILVGIPFFIALPVFLLFKKRRKKGRIS